MTPIFNISKEQAMLAIRHLLIGLGFALVTYLETFIPGFLNNVMANPLSLGIALSINAAIVSGLKAYLSDEDGRLGGKF